MDDLGKRIDVRFKFFYHPLDFQLSIYLSIYVYLSIYIVELDTYVYLSNF